MNFEAPLVTELTAVTDTKNINGGRPAGPWTSDIGKNRNDFGF
jgi:hypothetical protein